MHRSPGYLLLAILILLFLPGAPLPLNPPSIQAQVDGGIPDPERNQPLAVR